MSMMVNEHNRTLAIGIRQTNKRTGICNSRVTFVTKIIFHRTFAIITSRCNVIRDNTKLEGQVTGIGQSSPGSLWSP